MRSEPLSRPWIRNRSFHIDLDWYRLPVSYMRCRRVVLSGRRTRISAEAERNEKLGIRKKIINGDAASKNILKSFA